jgi:hypothetical protein
MKETCRIEFGCFGCLGFAVFLFFVAIALTAVFIEAVNFAMELF